MEYRRMGRSGLKLSALSLGAWVTFGRQVDESIAAECMTAAYDAGVNFFDNAEGYAEGRAEVVMGKILRRMKWPRESYVVSSKVFFGVHADQPNTTGLSRKHVFEACHAALSRLQLDHLDLYFCHRPDPETPIEETARAMHDLVAQGKVLYWGTSEWTAGQIREAHRLCREWHLTPPSVEQPQYNLLYRHRVEIEYAPLYDEFGLGLTTWSPLASGVLTGKYNAGIPPDSRLALTGLEWLRRKIESPAGKRKLEAVRELASIAKELDTTLPRLAIAWCLKNPRVSTVILGASRRAQLDENLGSLDVLPQITPSFVERLDRLTRSYTAPDEVY